MKPRLKLFAVPRLLRATFSNNATIQQSIYEYTRYLALDPPVDKVTIVKTALRLRYIRLSWKRNGGTVCNHLADLAGSCEIKPVIWWGSRDGTYERFVDEYECQWSLGNCRTTRDPARRCPGSLHNSSRKTRLHCDFLVFGWTRLPRVLSFRVLK